MKVESGTMRIYKKIRISVPSFCASYRGKNTILSKAVKGEYLYNGIRIQPVFFFLAGSDSYANTSLGHVK